MRAPRQGHQNFHRRGGFEATATEGSVGVLDSAESASFCGSMMLGRAQNAKRDPDWRNARARRVAT